MPDGYENLNQVGKKIQINKQALAESLPNVFQDAGQWMNASTVDCFKVCRRMGLIGPG